MTSCSPEQSRLAGETLLLPACLILIPFSSLSLTGIHTFAAF